MQTLGFGFSSLFQAQILLPVGYAIPRIAAGNRRNGSHGRNKSQSLSASDISFISSYEQALTSVKNLIRTGVWDAYFLEHAEKISKINSKEHLCSYYEYEVPIAILGGKDLLSSPKSIHHIQRRWFKAKGQKPQLDSAEEIPIISRIFKKKTSNMKKILEELVKKELSIAIFPSLVEEKGLNPDEKKRVQVAYMEGYVKATEKVSLAVHKNAIRSMYRITATFSLIILVVVFFLAIGGRGFRRVLLGNRNLVSPEEIDITFADVKGVEEAKQELQEIIEFLRNPDKFSTLGGKLPKGVLLVGPPGTGKTLLARAVAGEAGVPFFHAAGPEFDEILVGQGARRVRDLFANAKLKAPCVVFIDEIDSIGGKRTNSVLHPYANQTINQLLTEMDGFRQNEGVIVLGATNRRDDLDKALLRPGRFDVEVQVPIPDLKGREEILDLYLSRVKLGRDVDAKLLAKRTIGFTGADLENLVNQAALRASIESQNSVSMKYFESARDKVLMGPERKNKIPDPETNRNTAYHEGGHALVALYTKDATPLHKVTILPRGRSLGHTAFIPDKEEYGRTKSQLLASLDCAMGGRAAEELIFGADKVTSGAQSDLKNATDLATSMVKHLGMSEKVGLRFFEHEKPDALVKVNDVADATSEIIDSEIKRLLQESYERAKNILKGRAEEHRLLAEALLQYETLDAEEVKLVISGKDPKRAKR